ncbi:MAG TPA: MaoC family dehydratase N-terminal domain-containing protein [Burkholderiales bacterium]|nr:MaoC family dehydratase N-terminal domain-containing protein [Burkholderiales bacterium]
MAFSDIPRSVIGVEYDVFTYPAVTAAELIEYARSLGVTDPIYLDEAAAKNGPFGGLVAFPTYVVKLRGGKHMPQVVVREMSTGGFDAGKDIEFHAPIRPGDVITARSRVVDLYEKTGRSGSMWFVVYRQELVNQRGELLANVDSRMMQRGRSAPGAGGDRAEGER